MENKPQGTSFKKQVVYQIYPRSFKDSDGDGIGDIRGIIGKLDYLFGLGITAIWISPCFKSPMEDGGYDVEDYYEVDPLFGTNEDLYELIAKAKERGIRIILDLVVNHTSSRHRWFREALKGRDNPYHDYYVWSNTPNSLRSVFGGSAWEYVPGLNQYYLHLFAKGQPDLNWKNPRLRDEIAAMMNFWLDKGVYGFREDVIENIGKEPEKLITTNGPKLHEYLHELYTKAFKGRDSFSVGECWDADNVTRTLYTDPAREELNMVFQFGWFKEFENTPHGKFDRLKPDWKRVRDILFAQQTTLPLKSWNANFFSNHDLPRPSVNFSPDERHREDVSKLCLAIDLFMSGTPYIYQGEELGMEHPRFKSLGELRDVEELNHYEIFLKEGIAEERAFEMVAANGRDNSRTPMQWDSSKYAGFSTAEPWLPLAEDHLRHNVRKEEGDPYSALNFAKAAIRLRQGEMLSTVAEGEFVPLYTERDDVFAFFLKGEHPYCFYANISAKEVDNPGFGKEILLENKGRKASLPPYGFVIYVD